MKLSDKMTVGLATWFYLGKIPRAPGTFGTLGAIPLVWLLMQRPPLQYMLVTFIFTIGAVFVAQFYEGLVGQHDSKEVVIDEVAGFLVTMTWIPWSWSHVLAGFLLFRFFDILKPWPISYVDKKVGGGIGCVGDDLLAGIVSNVLLQALWQKGWL